MPDAIMGVANVKRFLLFVVVVSILVNTTTTALSRVQDRQLEADSFDNRQIVSIKDDRFLPQSFQSLRKSDPERFSQRIDMAAQAIINLENSDRHFLEAGADVQKDRSTISLHSKFIGTKEESIELGNSQRKRLALIKSLADGFKVEASSVANSLSRLKFKPDIQRAIGDQCPDRKHVICDKYAKNRTPDGSCNNINHPNWGRAFLPMRRYVKPAYDDRIASPRTRGRNRNLLPSPRLVSRTLHSSDQKVSDTKSITHMVMQWGQFLDHDLTSTPVQEVNVRNTGPYGSSHGSATCCTDDVSIFVNQRLKESLEKRDICFPIPIPPGDPRFGSRSCLNFVRSIQVPNSDCLIVPVEQLNQVSAYLDASQVYGSSLTEQQHLRAKSDGLLRTSPPSLLPKKHCTSTTSDFCFEAGDERVDEQAALTSMHTIWVRQHNKIANSLASLNSHWGNERLFQETRKIVGAMMQHITYNEFLPVVLNNMYMTKFNLKIKTQGFDNVYKPNMDASIRNIFATAAYRFGHSLIRSSMSFLNPSWVQDSCPLLRNMFLNTSLILANGVKPIDRLLRGLVVEKSKLVDRFMSPELTNHLFEDAEGNGLDLASLNIQRGRDHGLPGYNVWRKWCHLSKATHFGIGQGGLVDHSSSTAEKLKELYQHPDDIDIWSGGVSETSIDGGIVGPTFACILGHQFQALKEGDRFWFERNDGTVGFTEDKVNAIKDTSLSRVICDTTDIRQIQKNAFKTSSVGNPRVSCSVISPLNLSPWKDVSNSWSSWLQWSNWSPCLYGRRSRERVRLCQGPGCKISREYQKKYLNCYQYPCRRRVHAMLKRRVYDRAFIDRPVDDTIYNDPWYRCRDDPFIRIPRLLEKEKKDFSGLQ